jgi:hypothetical protein
LNLVFDNISDKNMFRHFSVLKDGNYECMVIWNTLTQKCTFCQNVWHKVNTASYNAHNISAGMNCLLRFKSPPSELNVHSSSHEILIFNATWSSIIMFKIAYQWSLSQTKFIQSTLFYHISLWFFLFFSSHLCWWIGFLTRILYEILICPMCDTYPTHFILLDLIILTSDEEWKLQSYNINKIWLKGHRM